MTPHGELLQKRFLIFIIPAFAGMVYLGSTVLSFSNNARNNIVKVNNHTQSFALLNAERHNGHVKLSLRNDSNKNITAFVISSVISPRGIFTVKEEFAYSEVDFAVAPSDSYEIALDLPGSLSNQKNVSLDLSAVIFDDQSSEGDPQVAQGIADERLAQKVQFTQAIALFDRLLALPDVELSTYFNGNFKRDLTAALNDGERNLRVQLRKARPQLMSRMEADELPEQMQVGLHSGKETLSEKIQDLEKLQKTQGAYALREEIVRIKQTYERIIRRL